MPTPYLAALGGSLLVAASLIIIWAARSTVLREAYVSELGAVGEPTATWFEAALLLIVLGGSAIAWAGRDIRSTAFLLRSWSPAVSLWVGCGFFFVASQVTCTAGCPLPVGDTFTWQDFVHTLAAVLAFAAACVAMLQASFATGQRALSRFSLAVGITVAVVAGVGGLLSLAEVGTDIGSVLELVATTLSIGWLVVFGVFVARRSLARHSLDAEAVSDAAQASREPDRRGVRAALSRSRRDRSTDTRAWG